MEITGTIPGDYRDSKSFDEILSPIRKRFQESGLSEDEMDVFFEEAREENQKTL